MCNLTGKTALVTGAARGIGRGIAVELARAGASVIVSDLKIQQDAQSVVAEIAALGHTAIALPLDVTDKESVTRCMREALGQFPRIDILVNNAGVFQRQLGLELGEGDFNSCLDVNLTGIWRTVQALVPHFKAQGGGKIINIASVGGRLGVDFAPAYCAAKAGVINLTQSLAAALGADRITVNTVCPGAVSTAMQEAIRTLRMGASEPGKGHPSPLPLAGPLTAQDIGYAVVFFASDLARHITGQALNVDCGELMN